MAKVQCLPSVTVTFFRVAVISITYGRVPARKKADCHQSTLLPRAARPAKKHIMFFASFAFLCVFARNNASESSYDSPSRFAREDHRETHPPQGLAHDGAATGLGLRLWVKAGPNTRATPTHARRGVFLNAAARGLRRLHRLTRETHRAIPSSRGRRGAYTVQPIDGSRFSPCRSRRRATPTPLRLLAIKRATAPAIIHPPVAQPASTGRPAGLGSTSTAVYWTGRAATAKSSTSS